MRALVLKELRDHFDNGDLTTPDDEEILDFTAEVESLTDQELLNLYSWTVGFQG